MGRPGDPGADAPQGPSTAAASQFWWRTSRLKASGSQPNLVSNHRELPRVAFGSQQATDHGGQVLANQRQHKGMSPSRSQATARAAQALRSACARKPALTSSTSLPWASSCSPHVPGALRPLEHCPPFPPSKSVLVNEPAPRQRLIGRGGTPGAPASARAFAIRAGRLQTLSASSQQQTQVQQEPGSKQGSLDARATRSLSPTSRTSRQGITISIAASVNARLKADGKLGQAPGGSQCCEDSALRQHDQPPGRWAKRLVGAEQPRPHSSAAVSEILAQVMTATPPRQPGADLALSPQPSSTNESPQNVAMASAGQAITDRARGPGYVSHTPEALPEPKGHQRDRIPSLPKVLADLVAEDSWCDGWHTRNQAGFDPALAPPRPSSTDGARSDFEAGQSSCAESDAACDSRDSSVCTSQGRTGSICGMNLPLTSTHTCLLYTSPSPRD